MSPTIIKLIKTYFTTIIIINLLISHTQAVPAIARGSDLLKQMSYSRDHYPKSDSIFMLVKQQTGSAQTAAVITFSQYLP